MRKIPQPHPIHRSGKFSERHSLRIVSDDSPKLCGNSTLPQNFHTRKLGEIMVSYAVVWSCQTLPDTEFVEIQCYRLFFAYFSMKKIIWTT